MKNISKFIFLLVFVTLFSCSSDKGARQTKASTLKDTKKTKKIMEIYSNNVNSFFQKNERLKNDHLEHLRKMWEGLVWTEVLKDDQILAMSTGKVDKGMIFVLSEDHPILHKPGPTLVTQKIAGYDGVLIRPYDVSSEWAAITMIHELVHLDHKLRGLDYSPDKEEYLAYNAEKKALNVLSEEKLNLEQEKLIKEMELNSYIQIIWNFKNNREHFQRKLMNLDEMVSSTKYKSMSELEMRLGFYAISITLDLLQRNNVNEEKSIRAVGQVLSEIGKY